MQVKEHNHSQPLGVLSLNDRTKVDAHVRRLRGMVGKRSDDCWDDAENVLRGGLKVLAEAFPAFGVGLLADAFTTAIDTLRGVHANRKDALKLGDLILSTAADVMETLSIELPKDLQLKEHVDKLEKAIYKAVDVMDTFCGKSFLSAAWSHKRDASELQSSADAIRDADKKLQRAVGHAALKYCARNQEQLTRTKKQVESLEKRFADRENEANMLEMYTFKQVVHFYNLVELKRDLIIKGDEATLERLVKASGSTGGALSQGMAEIGELRQALPAAVRVEAARTAERDAAERVAADLNALRAALEEREKAHEQAREQQERDLKAMVEQQVREQWEREQLRDWIAFRGLHQSILTDALVDLGGKGLGDKDMSAVALLIKFNASLEKLNLNNNQIGDSGAAALATTLPSMASLNWLSLSRNQIGDSGAAALATALPSMASLEKLWLYDNQIGDKGAAALAPAFASMASLKALGLEGNQIGDAGAAALAPAFKSMASMEKLWLTNNKIGDAGAAALAPAFKSMASLQVLALHGNKIGDEGAIALAPAFRSMASDGTEDLNPTN
jgi:hypothetical protein